jgi:hypothetical protein
VADTSLDWSGSTGDLLAVELDIARIADGVSFFSALAGIYLRCRWIDGAPNWQFTLETFASGFCFVIRRFLADLVDFRNNKSSDGKLGISGQPHFHSS